MFRDYPKEEYLRVAEECAGRLRRLLTARFQELEEERDAVNDRYPFDDLFLKWAEVDGEEALIRRLLQHLERCAGEMKDAIEAGKDFS